MESLGVDIYGSLKFKEYVNKRISKYLSKNKLRILMKIT